MSGSLDSAWLQESIDRLVENLESRYLLSKRWFGSKSREISGFRLVDVAILQSEPALLALLLLQISYEGAEPELYQLPLTFKPAAQARASIKEQPDGAAFVVDTGQGQIWAYDAFAEDAFPVALYRGMRDDTTFTARQGAVVGQHVPGAMETGDPRAIRRISTEQSNTSIVYDDRLILKAFRKVSPGRNPDVEIPYYLTTHTAFRYVPRVAGFVEYRTGADAISLAVVQDFVANQGDGYTATLQRVRAFFAAVIPLLAEGRGDGAAAREEQAAALAGPMPREAHRLGYITGLMHDALAADTDLPDFRPEPITAQVSAAWEEHIGRLIAGVTQNVRDKLPTLPAAQQELLRPLTGAEGAFRGAIAGLGVLAQQGCHRTRCHGDYHLGQVLKTGDDYMILDFEGEPARTLAERRAKHCPLRDVAGMLRSFDYAANAILFDLWAERGSDAAEQGELEGWAMAWEGVVRGAFLQGYGEATAGHAGPRFAPPDAAAFRQVVEIFEVEKAFYELNYEFNNRPDWVPVPAKGLARLLQQETGEDVP